MRIIKTISLIIFLISAFVAGVIYFPYSGFIPEINKQMKFDISTVENYLNEQEKKFPNLRQGLQKRIIWGAESGKKTKLSFVFLPGFTATQKEISPVVERIAEKYHANLFFSRLPAHGEEVEDFKRVQTQDIFDTTFEAYQVGKVLGEKTILVGSSTGASLLLYAVSQLGDVDGVIMFSPAFYSYWDPKRILLNKWLALPLVKLVLGETYSWGPYYPEQEKYWNTKYNTDILPKIIESFYVVSQQSYEKLNTPVLMFYNPIDHVIDAEVMEKKFLEFKTKASKKKKLDSRDRHVLAGDIASPANTSFAIEESVSWLQSVLQN